MFCWTLPRVKVKTAAQTLFHFELMRQRPAHTVHRLYDGERQFILKTFYSNRPAREIQVYALLQSLGVPTLPIYLRGAAFLLMEDLQTSPTWRLAQPEDMRRAEVGLALAAWYRDLHLAGKLFFQQNERPNFLESWIDRLETPALAAAGQKLGLNSVKSWQAALDRVEALKTTYRSFPQTFNYSDFAEENLAVSRAEGEPQSAVVFDYDCFAIGTVYSDVRNVISGLEGPARAAFQEAYGPVDPAEEAADGMLSMLEGILVASHRDRIPAWARPIIDAFQHGLAG